MRIVYIACELTRAVDDKSKIAARNLAHNDPTSRGQVVEVYYASRTYDQDIGNELTGSRSTPGKSSSVFKVRARHSTQQNWRISVSASRCKITVSKDMPIS